MSNPATIQVIKNIIKHPNADTLDIVEVLGWQCVSKTGTFKTGDKCVYIEIDSVCPDKPTFEFLSSSKFRVKTIRLRGELSQGLCLPLSEFPDVGSDIGMDISEKLGVTHYEKPIPDGSESVGHFLPGVPKTDEPMVQSSLGVLDELKGKPYYISEKADGSSITVFIGADGSMRVFTRNHEVGDKSKFWITADKCYSHIKVDADTVIQGELVGPKIQKNKYNLTEYCILAFNIFRNNKYLDFKDFVDFCINYKIASVKIIETADSFDYKLEELIRMAEGKYLDTDNEREGIVIRSQKEMYSETTGARLSFKVLNNKSLLGN